MHHQATRDQDTHRARAHGRLVGSRPDGQARDCPFSHYRLALRNAWMEGFGEGRHQVRQKPDAAFDSEAGPERVTYAMDLTCSRCGVTGIALLSENASRRTQNVEFRIELVSPGFHADRKGRSLGATTFVCDPCGAAAR